HPPAADTSSFASPRRPAHRTGAGAPTARKPAPFCDSLLSPPLLLLSLLLLLLLSLSLSLLVSERQQRAGRRVCGAWVRSKGGGAGRRPAPGDMSTQAPHARRLRRPSTLLR